VSREWTEAIFGQTLNSIPYGRAQPSTARGM